jgi:hypothetical protein
MTLHIKLAIITILLLTSRLVSYSHNLKGAVSGKDGTPISYATVFIKEVSLGTTTNEDGRFELDLPPGVYTANFRSLGYIPKIVIFTLNKKITEVAVTLEEQAIQMNQIDIRTSNEDPAYPIIRKVIGLSYVHLNQVNSYSADVYIKSTVKFENIPVLIRNQLKRKDIDVKSGDVLVNETVSLIDYLAPDKYQQHIRSVNSTFPKVVEFSIDEFLKASLYQDNIGILFSPLSKNAFSYYNYRYEGFQQEGKYTVNKIKVIPKRKSKQLFEGYIYILEDLWCLSRADLSFDVPFGAVSFRLVFDEVLSGVWMPVGHDYTFNGGMMGVRGSARFGASIKYNKLKGNDKVLAMIGIQPATSTLITNATNQPAITSNKSRNQPASKKEDKIGHLLEKDKLTNRDMSKLSKLMAQEDNSRKPDSLNSLEIKDEVKVIIEKGAGNRDTSYWALMRPIPLSIDEITSFRQRDSLLMVQKKYLPDTTSVISHKRNYGVLNPLFFGIRRPLKDSTWSLKYEGLVSTKMISFNAVDGWKIAQSIVFTRNFKPGNSLTITPYIAYAIDRDKILATGALNYDYAPFRRGSFELSGGRNTFDFNPSGTVVHPFINSVASLFYKENFARFYENRFINFTNKIDIKNGLVMSTTLKWSNIRQLENSTNFSFLKKGDNYRENQPTNKEISNQSLEDQINTVIGVKIEYTPKYFHRVNKGVKTMSDSSYPTFFLEYKKGIRELFSGTADFDYLGTGLQYSKELSSTSSFATELRGGWFPNNNRIHFSDFAHAQTQTSPILLREYRHSFFLPGYYSLSTSDKFFQAHVSVRAPYIALKYLPGLSNTLWREMVWCSYYTSPVTRNYIEIGYTLLEVLLSANIGTHVGFDDGKFSNIGINLAFRISY